MRSHRVAFETDEEIFENPSCYYEDYRCVPSSLVLFLTTSHPSESQKISLSYTNIYHFFRPS